MADYRDLLRRAIEALPDNNGNARRLIYDKARAALRRQLDEIVPEVPSRERTKHRLQLEECIREVEQEVTEQILDGLKYAGKSSPPPLDPLDDIEKLLADATRLSKPEAEPQDDTQTVIDHAIEVLDKAARGGMQPDEAASDLERRRSKVSNELNFVSSAALPPEALEFEVTYGRYRIAIDTDEDDFAVARRFSFRGDLEDLREKSSLLCSLLDGKEEGPGWEGFAEATSKVRALLEQEPADIAGSISRLWSAFVSLGSFLEQDNRMKDKGPGTNAPPLSESVRRALQDLVRTAAPLVREFPTARRKDDEAGAFLKELSGFHAAESVFAGAQQRNLLEDETQSLIRQLIAAVERGDFQGNKAKRTTIGSAQALIRKTIEYTLAGYVSTTIAVADLPEVQASAEFLLASRNQITEIFSGSPDDLRLAIDDLLGELEIAVLPSKPAGPDEDGEEGVLF